LDRSSARDADADQHRERVEKLTRGADLGPVADVLTARRTEMLDRWLEVTQRQPFHQGRRGRAVADHLPHLIDALLDVLRRTSARDARYEAALDDERVLDAAKQHAFVRFEQGLGAADVVTEFRLLRHEISRALRLYLRESESPADVVAAELVVNDALDGATALSLQALTDRVEEVRADFLATTLHDAQQPITTVRLSVELAERSIAHPAADLAKARDALHRALHGLDRMTVLLRRLSDASRLALGSLEIRHEETGLGEVVRRVIDQLDPEAARRVNLTTDDDNDAGLWDSAGLEQVIGNLLSNAVKFSPADSPIEVRVTGDGAAVRLSVRDHGFGVDPDDVERIFRRFSRSQAARDERVEGQGLGLYLSRGIVEAHGGRIWVESEGSCTGSVFHVGLPRQPRPPEAEEFEPETASGDR